MTGDSMNIPHGCRSGTHHIAYQKRNERKTILKASASWLVTKPG